MLSPREANTTTGERSRSRRSTGNYPAAFVLQSFRYASTNFSRVAMSCFVSASAVRIASS